MESLWHFVVKPFLTLLLGTSGVISLVLFVIYLRLLPYRKKTSVFGSIKGAIPLVRHIGVHLSLLRNSKFCGDYDVHCLNYATFEATVGKKDGLVSIILGTVPMLVVYRADHVEQVFGNSRNIMKGPMYKLLTPWLGEGLLTSHGSKWKSRRKFLTPAFHFKILNTFAVTMNQQAKIFTERIENKTPDEDMLQYVEAFTLDVVCETIMGTSMNCQLEGSGRDYLTTIKNVSHILVRRFIDPLNWIDLIFNRTKDGREFNRLIKELHQFTTKVINERKAELLAAPETLESMTNSEDAMANSKKPFLDLMLVEHLKTNSLTIQDIREEVDTFMFEGHDTTSMGLTWALYFIGLHQDVQQKLHEEIDSVFQEDLTCDVTVDHIKQLKYLEMVLKESQRLCPSVSFVTRKVVEEFETGGKRVPKGAEVLVFIKILHEDPDVFPKPHEFDPERFSPENSRHRHPYAFVPFSAGPRNCIGQRFAMLEEKILLVWVLRKFRIKSLDPRDKIFMKADLVLRPACPIRMAIQKRV